MFVTATTLAPPQVRARSPLVNQHTVDVFVDVLPHPESGKKGGALRMLLCDKDSVDNNKPSDRHALNVFGDKCRAHMNLPQAPRGVREEVCRLRPANAADNPLKDISWVFNLTTTCNDIHKQPAAANFMAKKGVALLQQGLLAADINIEPVNGEGGRTYSAEITDNGIKLTRTGDKRDKTGSYFSSESPLNVSQEL